MRANDFPNYTRKSTTIAFIHQFATLLSQLAHITLRPSTCMFYLHPPVLVVGEVSVLLMIPRAGHVGQMGSYRLDLPHERVAHLALVVEHVVREVAHVNRGVVHLLLRVVHEEGQR